MEEERPSTSLPRPPSTHSLQSIHFYEKSTTGKTSEKNLTKKKFLDIQHFTSLKQEPGSENWDKLNKRAQNFYLGQNEEIDQFNELEHVLSREPSTGEAVAAFSSSSQSPPWAEKFVIYLSFGTNIILVIALILAVVFSGSISIVASVVDSSLDIFSSLIFVITERAKNKVDYYQYPQGKERLEPVGVLVFSAVMGTSSLLLIIEAIKRLVSDPMEPPTLDYISVGFLSGDIFIKFVLFLVCRRIGRNSGIGRALAQDHRNDVILNSVALISFYIGSAVWPPTDSVGAIVISLWTMYNWGSSCIEQVKLLTGRSASPEFLKKLTWVCFNHNEKILGIDTVRAFHFGTRYLVEIDIVLPPEMPLKEAHDIGESLQQKVEFLEEVERAFVHLDFETSHDPRSEHKQWGSVN